MIHKLFKVSLTSFVLMIIQLSLYGQSSVKYDLRFNATSCLYEVHMVVQTDLTSPNIGTASVSIVLDGSYPNNIINATAVNPSTAAWSNGSQEWDYVYGSKGTYDYQQFSTNGGTLNSGTSLLAGTDITLFTFSLMNSNCTPGIRLWRNNDEDIPAYYDPDPDKWDPYSVDLPNGGTFNMGMSLPNQAFIVYQGNIENPIVFPTYTAGITATVNGSNIDLAATVTGLSSYLSSSMSYKWYDYSNTLLGTTSTPSFTVTNGEIGFYKVVTTNNYGCTAEATTDYTVCAWRSTTNGSWNDYAIWEALLCDGGWVNTPTPPNNDRPIYVFHTVTIPASTTINADSLFVEPSGIVSVPSTSTLNVTDQLVIKINTDGNAGQFNSNGSCNNIVTSTAKTIVRKALDNTWDFISFPFEITESNVFISGTNTNSNTQAVWGDISPSTSNAHFYAAQYDGASRAVSENPSATVGNYWINVSGKTFVPVRGYIISGGNRGASSVDFVAATGTQIALCGGEYSPEVFAGTPECNGGWCLVGNPYASNYDLFYANPHKAYYVAPAYATVADGQHVTYNAFGAFFMQATSAIPVSFPISGLPQLAPRQTQKYNNLELAINNTVRSNKTLVRLAEDANVNYQLGEDAMNLNINASAPQIYSEASGACTGLAVNTLPLNTERVDLKVRIATLGTYTIKLTNKEILNNIKAAILVDTETGLQTDLINSEDGYTFDATATGTSSRFYILLSPNISTIIDRNGNEDIDVIIKGKNISLSGLNGKAGVRMYDVVGKLMYKYNELQNGQSFDVNVPGVYLMDINTKTQDAKIKVLIQN